MRWALAFNFADMVCKFGAAYLTGSKSLFAEGVHSLMDTVNQVILYVGKFYILALILKKFFRHQVFSEKCGSGFPVRLRKRSLCNVIDQWLRHFVIWLRVVNLPRCYWTFASDRFGAIDLCNFFDI